MKRFPLNITVLALCGIGLLLASPALAESDQDAEPVAPRQAQDEDSPALPAASATPSRLKESERAPNSIYAELLGAGLVYSVNYERLVLEDLGVHAGLSYIGVSATAGTSEGTAKSSVTFMTIPVGFSYLGIGSKHHMLELGGNLSFLYIGGSASGFGVSSSGSGMLVLPNALVGYRLHPVDGAGFQFRVGAMFFAGKGFDDADPSKFGMQPWGYISFGASF